MRYEKTMKMSRKMQALWNKAQKAEAAIKAAEVKLYEINGAMSDLRAEEVASAWRKAEATQAKRTKVTAA